MNGWKPPGPTSPNGLQPNGTILPPSKMITPNFHGSPLKNPPGLNGCNGHIKVNHYKNLEVIGKQANGHHHPQKNGLGINAHLQLMKDHCCCLRPTLSSKSVNSDQDDSQAERAAEREDDEETEESCGLWSFRPRWLQQFANKKAFLAIFCLTSVLQGMYYTYFVSVLTTIEKLFQIQSKWTGIIMSSTEMGQIFGALLLTYYGGQGHRPKWIAYGMLVFAFAAILCATPHFLFREVTAPRIVEENSTTIILKELRTKLCSTTRQPLSSVGNRQQIPSTTSAYSSYNSSTSPPSHQMLVLNDIDYISHDDFFLLSENGTLNDLGLAARSDAYRTEQAKCDKGREAGNSHHDKVTNWVLIIFFVSLLLIGIGATAVYTLGIPYIDDNVATRESPLYFGITIGVRIFGPVFGFLLGSYCTSVYVHPFQDTDLTPDDPQWIGAWWLGVFIVGAALILTTFPMMAFPKKLPQSPNHQNRHNRHHHNRHNHLHSSSSPAPPAPVSVPPLLTSSSKHENSFSKSALIHPSNGNNGNGVTICNSRQCHHNAYYKCSGTLKPTVTKHSLRDFLSALKRLVTNVTLMLRTASSVLHILPIAGLYTFLPKYLESQFQLTATKANMIAGMAGILVMGFGIFASGSFMRKFKPSARFVAGWIAIAALAYSIGMVILMWLGCPLNNYVGLNAGSYADATISQKSCNGTCDCRPGEFAPICTKSNITYLAPCLAGCTKVEASAKDQFVYKDCHCLEPNETATNGFCALQCDNLTWYILVFSVFVLIHSTSEVGSMLLTLRCVDPKDKALALGLISFAIGLFGNVPCPIIYGAVVDSACLFWEDNCGEPGACRVYDPSKFRIAFHGVTAGIMFVAFLVDVMVWFKAHDIQFSAEEEEEEEEETESLASGGEEERPLNCPVNNSNFESSV